MSVLKKIVFSVFTLMSTMLYAQSEFILGQDLSYVNMMEDCGAEFREDGETKDVYQIFADNGTNLIRVRLWHNPSWQETLVQPDGVKAQYSNFEDVKETIFRAKLAGMKVMLGFHFSDFWSDPGRQILPKAWEGVTNNESALKDSIYNYVYHTLELLNDEDLMPEYVKVGNENNSGIMTHKGMNSHFEGETVLSWDWSRHARLYNTAIKAVRDISETSTIQPKIALHVADHNRATWFYNNIIAKGVTDFDVMGFTYYYSYHGGSPAEVGNVIKSLLKDHSEYEAMIVETGYLWDTQNIDGLGNIINNASPDYLPVSPANQKQFMVDLSNEVYKAGGSGLIFWESAWVSTPCTTPWGTGSSQEHVAFFDHRNNLNYMKEGGGGWPNEFGNIPVEKLKSNVTLKVNMSNEDSSNGVYVVGTLSNWEFIKMELKNDEVYQTTMELNVGDTHAYYFITSDNWTDFENYRETVPEECATSDELLNDPDWTTDRAFVVPEQDTTIAVAWESCNSFPSSKEENELNQGFNIFPNPSNNNSINIEFKGNIKDFTNFSIFNAKGQKENISIQLTPSISKYQIDGLERGIYLVSLTVKQKNYSQKLMVL